jgi:hypothetical protein
MRDGNIFNWLWFEAMDFAEYYSGIVFYLTLGAMCLVNWFVYLVGSHEMFLNGNEENLILQIIYLACMLYHGLASEWWWLWLAIPLTVTIMVWAHTYCYAYEHCRSWGGKYK